MNKCKNCEFLERRDREASALYESTLDVLLMVKIICVTAVITIGVLQLIAIIWGH
jgi:hypothetical protein